VSTLNTEKLIENLLGDIEILKAQNEALHTKVHRRNWFSKEMIGIYSAVLVGIGAWSSMFTDMLEHRAQENQRRSEKTEVRRRVDTVMFEYVNEQIAQVYETCDLHMEAFLRAMSPYQRRKTERFLNQEDEAVLSEMPELEFVGPPPARISVPMPEIYRQLRQSAEEGRPVYIKDAVQKIEALRKARR